MDKTVFRYDRGGALRSPVTTPQGFLRIGGHAARVGIYKYRRADGSVQRELRPAEEVFHPDSLASYDAASITLEHPVDEEVNAENVRRHEVGTVSGAGRRDDSAVATELVIKDAKAIKTVKAGKQELSPGYKIRLDETPGFAPEYADGDNPTGRYDVVQRDIRVNHLAIVDRARGGSAMRLRMDAAEEVLREDAGGGNPNHDDHGRFAAGSSASAHGASAAATSQAGHQHAAQLHEQAAAAHRTAGNRGMAQAHDLIAQHHKTVVAAFQRSGTGIKQGVDSIEPRRPASGGGTHSGSGVDSIQPRRATSGVDTIQPRRAVAGAGTASHGVDSIKPRRHDDVDEVHAAMSHFDQQRWADSSQEKTAYHQLLARAAALRVDASSFKDAHAARLDSGGKLTTVADGHQHLVDPCGWDGQQRSSGETSYALAEGADVSHSHPWTMGVDGTIVIGEAAGHQHAVIDAASAPAPAGYLAPTAYSTT